MVEVETLKIRTFMNQRLQIFATYQIFHDESILLIPCIETPTTSQKDQSNFIKFKHPYTTSQDSSDDDKCEFSIAENRHALEQSIISIMKDSIEYDELYISYFMKLVDIKDGVSDDYDALQFNSKCLPKNRAIISTRNVTERTKWKSPCADTPYPLGAGNIIVRYDKTLIEDLQYKPKSKVGKAERMLKRTELLTQLELCHKHDKHYELLIEQLIDLEETFTEE